MLLTSIFTQYGMKHKKHTYEIEVELSTGDRIQARVEANGNAEAMERLLANDYFIKFCAGASIVKSSIRRVELARVDENRFALVENGDEITAVDLDARFKVVFRRGNYNGNIIQRIGESPENATKTALDEATALRQLADWLIKYRPDLIGKTPVED